LFQAENLFLLYFVHFAIMVTALGTGSARSYIKLIKGNTFSLTQPKGDARSHCHRDHQSTLTSSGHSMYLEDDQTFAGTAKNLRVWPETLQVLTYVSVEPDRESSITNL